MARHPIGDEQKAALLEAYRRSAEPGSHASHRAAAAAAKLDRRTAARAWHSGIGGSPPIKAAIEAERTMARAALRREQLAKEIAAATALAAEDAAASRSLQGQSVRLLCERARSMLRVMHEEGIESYERSLVRLAKDEDPGSTRAVGARRALLDLASVLAKVSEVAERGARLESAILGDPSVTVAGSIELRPVLPATITSAQLAEQAQAALRAAEYMREQEAEAVAKQALPPKGGDGAVHQPQ